MKHYLRLSALALSLFAVGCAGNDLFSDIHIKPNTSLPVGMLSVTDSSLFAMAGVTEQLKVNEQGVLKFEVKHEVAFTNEEVINNIFKFKDQNVAFRAAIPGWDQIPGGVPGDLINIADIAPEGIAVTGKINVKERIDNMVFTDGSVVMELTNENGYDTSGVVCTLPNLLRNGVALVVRDGQRVDFNDGATYVLHPLHDTEGGNLFKMVFTGQVPLMQSITGHVLIQEKGVKQVEGFFGNKTVSTQTTKIQMPADFSSFTAKVGDIYLANPSIKIAVSNTIKAPTLVEMRNLKAISTVNGAQVETIMVLKADRSKMFVAWAGNTDFVIDNDSFEAGSKNLSDVMDKTLVDLVVISDVIINPTALQLGDLAPAPEPDAQVVNKLSADAKMDAVFNVDIPMDAMISDINVVSASDVDLSGLDSKDTKVEELVIAFSGTNNLPMDISLMADVRQGDVETGAATPLFSEAVVIPAANSVKPGGAGFVPGMIPADKMVIVNVSQNAIDKLVKAKKLFINIKASTFGADQRLNVKFYSPSSLDLKLMVGLKADLVISQ